MRAHISQIRKRLEQIYQQHLARWAKGNPEPHKPAAHQVLVEIHTESLEVNLATLEEAMGEKREYETVTFIEVISTPSLRRYRDEVGNWMAREKAFEEEAKQELRSCLDRLLCDCSSGTAFEVLQWFEHWRGSEEEESE